MKRKFFHRILPLIMAFLMVIGTLPADFGFSVDAYAAGEGGGAVPGDGSQSENLTVNFTVKEFQETQLVDNKKLDWSVTITDSSGNVMANFTGEGISFSRSFNGNPNETYSYKIKCNNYTILSDLSTTVSEISGPFTFANNTANVEMNVSSYTFTPNFARATTLNLLAEPESVNAPRWGEKVTLKATATSNSENDSPHCESASYILCRWQCNWISEYQ